jgi:hypothetical protein
LGKSLLAGDTTAFVPHKLQEEKNLAPDSKTRRNVHPEVPLQLIPERVATANSRNIKKTSRKRRKEKAEEPLYLRRM